MRLVKMLVYFVAFLSILCIDGGYSSSECDTYCRPGSVCVDLIENKHNNYYHHYMSLISDGSASVNTGFDARTWTCSCSNCNGLEGTWYCPGFYNSVINIASDTRDIDQPYTTVRASCESKICVARAQYIVGPNPLNWYDAQKYCQEKESELASIHSATDWKAAKTVCKSVAALPSSSWGCWIGLKQTSGSWGWSDSSPLDYGFVNNVPTKGIAPWWRDDPNGLNQCVHLWNAAHADYTLTDYLCSHPAMYPICKKPRFDYEMIARQAYGLWSPDLSKRHPPGCYDSIYGDHFFLHLGSCGAPYTSYLDASDNKYHFKLVWNTIKKWDFGSKQFVNHNEAIILKWSQTSWIQSNTIIGFEAENDFPVIPDGAPWGGAPFVGLAFSDYWGCYIGNPGGYNCIGLGTSQGNGFICYGGNVCGSFELYVGTAAGSSSAHSLIPQIDSHIDLNDDNKYYINISSSTLSIFGLLIVLVLLMNICLLFMKCKPCRDKKGYSMVKYETDSDVTDNNI